ncbi:eukaryotic mitochondrial regulator protein-domain-containing protein [Gongronella butleri]|nr:eukaryotic mitochondrial regulator protein-domain-containing protein [Gongronella butleri]
MLRHLIQPSKSLQSAVCATQKRSLWSTLPRFAEEEQSNQQDQPSDVDQSEPVKLSRRRRRFHEWVKAEGSKYTRPAEGTTNYLGNTPFPNNPQFQPRPPLSDARREEVYQLYLSDPETWTIRQLAVKYGYSLKRIEAILKLKQSEKDMEANGVTLQRQFAKGMEQYMGADQPVAELQEPLIDIFPNVGKPRMELLEENQPFTAKEAAEILHRKPYKQLEKRAIALEEAKFGSHTAPTTPKQTNSKFIIVDSSKK